MAKLLETKITDEYVRPEYLGKCVGMVQQKSRVEDFPTYKDVISHSTQEIPHNRASYSLHCCTSCSAYHHIPREVDSSSNSMHFPSRTHSHDELGDGLRQCTKHDVK
jgi:hypothetical protein